jgi:hypothetical protein
MRSNGQAFQSADKNRFDLPNFRCAPLRPLCENSAKNSLNVAKTFARRISISFLVQDRPLSENKDWPPSRDQVSCTPRQSGDKLHPARRGSLMFTEPQSIAYNLA